MTSTQLTLADYANYSVLHRLILFQGFGNAVLVRLGNINKLCRKCCPTGGLFSNDAI